MSETAETDRVETHCRGDAGRVMPSTAPDVLAQRLEREGDIAADYIEELLDIADLDGDIDMDVEGERAMVIARRREPRPPRRRGGGGR